MRPSVLAFIAAIALASPCRAGEAVPDADPRTGADLLPASTVIFAEVTAPADLIRTITDHPLLGRLEQLHAYEEGLGGLKLVPLRIGVAFAELQLGMKWDEALTALTERGIWTAVNGPDQGNLVLIKARDAKTLGKIRDTLLKFAREDAKKKDQPSPFEEERYRDITVYKVKDGGGGFTTIGPWLLIGNKAELGRATIDALLDNKAGGLAADENFLASKKLVQGRPTAWVYTNLKAIRDAGVAPKVYSGRADDPGGELLVGGILEALKSANHSITTLDVTRDHLALQIGLPCRADGISEQREYYFGPKGTGVSPALPKLDGLLFGLGSYRDISQMWLRAGDLFDEGMNEKLAQADSQLATLFSGKDFGEDILGAFAPQVQFLATRQAFSNEGPRPSIKLPAFAIAFEMKDPEATRREMRRIFQSFIGFLNVVGAMNGQPQLELDIEKGNDFELVASSYIPEKGEEQSTEAKIQFNFSPTVGFHGKQFVLASTRQLARDLASCPPAPTSETANTIAMLNAPVLREVLNDNLAHLVSQNMLKEGQTREEAQHKIDDLLKVIGFFRGAAFDLKLSDGQLRADLRFEFSPEPAPLKEDSEAK